MNEDFVPKELTRKLKEKGYPLEKVFVSDGRPVLYDLPMSDPDWFKCDAWYIPTIAGVLKWLREEKKIYIIIDRSFSYKSWHYCIIIDDDFENLISQTVSRKQTWEQAALKAIEYALDNLISNKTT